METKLRVDGMSCGHCVRAVKEALENVDGVQAAEVDLENNSAKVQHNDATDVQVLIAAVEEEGYTAARA